MSKVYGVVSRDYDYTEYIADLGIGPTTTERDFCMVTAANKKEARIRGVRAFRKMKAGFLKYDDEHPFKGLKVEEITNPEELADAQGSDYFFNFDVDNGCTCALFPEDQLCPTCLSWG